MPLTSRTRAGIAAALALVFAASPVCAASFIEGSGGTAVVQLTPDAVRAAPYLTPGGPWVRHVVDLGVDGRDFALVDDLVLIAARDEGVLVYRLQSDGAPRLVARMPGLRVSSIAADGSDRAWAIDADGLIAIDLSTPDAPRIAARLRTPAEPRAFEVHDGRGYLLLPRELRVLDLGHDGPAPASRHGLAFDANGVAVADGTVHIAAGHAGLVMLRPAEPDAPLAVWDAGAPVLAVEGDGDRLYLAHGDEGLSVLARGRDGDLAWLGDMRGPRPIAGIRAHGGRALAHSGDGDLFLLDVENPRAMAFSALLADGDCCEAYGYAASGAVALAGGRMIALELGDEPPALSNEGLAFGQGVNYGGQRRVTIANGLAYVADWFSGLHIYDLATPGRPTLLSSLRTGGSPKGVVVRGGYAYVADDDHGLLVVDVGDPRHPREAGRLPLPGLAYTPVLDGDRLYVAVHHGGIVVVDVSDPATPALAAHYDTPGKAWSLRVRDGLVWVADDDAGLLILDTRAAGDPRLVGRFEPGGQVEEVLIDGDIAWLAVYDQGVFAVDITDPAAPTPVAHLRTRGNPRGLALHGDLLFVADWLAGVTILDVSDPVSPRVLGRRGTDGAAWGLALHDGIAFIADWWGGISLLDVSDPTRPAPAGRYPAREAVRAVAVAGRFALAAQGDGGLQVFDIANPLNPTWVTGVDLDGARDALITGEHAFVLHGDGRRVAVIDLGDPFQARHAGDIELAHTAHALREVAGGAIALGEDGWSRIAAGAHAVRLPGDAPIDVWAAAGRTLVADREGRLRELDESGRVTAALATFPAIAAVRGDSHRAAVYVPDEGLHLFVAGDDGALEAFARVPFEGPVDALQVVDDEVFVASGRTLRIVRVDGDGHWRVTGSHRMMEDITGLAAYQGVVYLAGSPALRAIEPLAAPAITVDAGGSARIEVPPGLPPGAWDVAAGRVADAAAPAPVLLRNAFTVEPLRFGAQAAPAQ